MAKNSGTLVVPAAKVKVCEECKGHWAWRQTVAGKWYKANAVYMGEQPSYNRYEVTYATIYHVNVLSHFKFCGQKAVESNYEIYKVEKQIADFKWGIETAKENGGMPEEFFVKSEQMIAELEAQLETMKEGA